MESLNGSRVIRGEGREMGDTRMLFVALDHLVGLSWHIRQETCLLQQDFHRSYNTRQHCSLTLSPLSTVMLTQAALQPHSQTNRGTEDSGWILPYLRRWIKRDARRVRWRKEKCDSLSLLWQLNHNFSLERFSLQRIDPATLKRRRMPSNPNCY